MDSYYCLRCTSEKQYDILGERWKNKTFWKQIFHEWSWKISTNVHNIDIVYRPQMNTLYGFWNYQNGKKRFESTDSLNYIATVPQWVGSRSSTEFTFSLDFVHFIRALEMKFGKTIQPQGWTTAPMFVLIYKGRIFGDELAKPNTLDDIAKPQHKQILVLASLWLFFCKSVNIVDVTRFFGK